MEKKLKLFYYMPPYVESQSLPGDRLLRLVVFGIMEGQTGDDDDDN